MTRPAVGSPLMRCAEAFAAAEGNEGTPAEVWRDEVAAELIHTAAQVATLVNGTAPGSVRRDLDIVKASRP